MKIKTEEYSKALLHWPKTGQHILAHQQEEMLVVYQAYNPAIAEYAVQFQQMGGPHYSYNRMSWIKPNFLWMMYRCGWAEKENQERVLALWIRKEFFDGVLEKAVYSAYQKEIYETEANWKLQLAQEEVRLQWDPDHDPYGNRQTRRALQLGLIGAVLKTFGQEALCQVEDITAFVKEQYQSVVQQKLTHLQVPEERLYLPGKEETRIKLRLD
jgi:Domain of unknown function (DUF4291)